MPRRGRLPPWGALQLSLGPLRAHEQRAVRPSSGLGSFRQGGGQAQIARECCHGHHRYACGRQRDVFEALDVPKRRATRVSHAGARHIQPTKGMATSAGSQRSHCGIADLDRGRQRQQGSNQTTRSHIHEWPNDMSICNLQMRIEGKSPEISRCLRCC